MQYGFEMADRPVKAGRQKTGFAAAVRATLTAGNAVHVPVVNGETYAIVRNRACSAARVSALQLGATLRTAKAPDGGVLVWLEPKA